MAIPEWLKNKRFLSLCTGTVGVLLVFISIYLFFPSHQSSFVPLDPTYRTEQKTTPPPTTKDECLFSLMKRTGGELLTFCYREHLNEEFTIYSNGTVVCWSGDEIRRVTNFLKRAFESMEPLEEKTGYHLELIPYLSLRFEHGVLKYGIIDQMCKVSSYAIYTMYHWFCF